MSRARNLRVSITLPPTVVGAKEPSRTIHDQDRLSTPSARKANEPQKSLGLGHILTHKTRWQLLQGACPSDPLEQSVQPTFGFATTGVSKNCYA